jgi:hypothetical protein
MMHVASDTAIAVWECRVRLGERQIMTIQRRIKSNIRKSILRTREANLNTTAVLEACCYIDGLGQRLFHGGPEYRFKKYIELHMPDTFTLLEKRSKSLGQKDDFCLHALWRDVRCGLVHEIDPKSKSVVIGRGKTSVHLNTKDKRWAHKDLVLSSPRFIDEFLKSINNI